MYKKNVTLLAVGCVVVFTLAGLITAQVINRHWNSQEIGKNAPQLRATPPRVTSQQQDEATPIQDGVMSEKMKKHSKLFKQNKYEYATGGKKLRELAKERKGNVDVGSLIGELIMPNSFDVEEYLQNISCKADAVVVGTVTGKSTQITEEGTFTFTEYQFSVSEILKNNYLHAININDELTIIRGGGALRIDGKLITAIDYSEFPLEKNGKYLLYLNFIPETNSYRSLEPTIADTSFRFSRRQVKQVSGFPFPFGPGQAVEADEFMTKVQAHTSPRCGN